MVSHGDRQIGRIPYAKRLRPAHPKRRSTVNPRNKAHFKYVLLMDQSRLWADTSNIALAMLIDYVLLPIRRVRYVHHHVCMLLLVQSRQRYTLLDVCTVPVCIHAINVHGCVLTVDLQPVPPPDDEKSAMRAIVNFLADAHGYDTVGT